MSTLNQALTHTIISEEISLSLEVSCTIIALKTTADLMTANNLINGSNQLTIKQHNLKVFVEIKVMTLRLDQPTSEFERQSMTLRLEHFTSEFAERQSTTLRLDQPTSEFAERQVYNLETRSAYLEVCGESLQP